MSSINQDLNQIVLNDKKKKEGDKSICRKLNWNSILENKINEQINAELSASHIYKALSSFFDHDSQSYPGVSEFFKESSKEELEHAEKFIHYQNIRGGMVSIGSIEAPILKLDAENSKESVVYQAFVFALELEQSIYEKIISISKDCNDPGLEDFLDDFIKEQLEAQYQLGIKIKQLSRIGNDGHGLWNFDLNLQKLSNS